MVGCRSKEDGKMNIETLKYLGERVDRARGLLERSKTLKDVIDAVKQFREDAITISGYVGFNNYQLHKIHISNIVDYDSAEKIKAAIVQVLEEYAESLKKEFEEL